jgi:DNA-binding transcriptional LysR family regulator
MISVSLGRDERNVIVGSPTYLAGRALPIAPTDLAKHDCIRMRLPDGAVYRWEFEKDGEQLLVDVSGRLTLNDVGLIREAALAGCGLAYISEWEVADDLHEGRLVHLLADWTPPFPGVASTTLVAATYRLACAPSSTSYRSDGDAPEAEGAPRPAPITSL